MASRSLRQDIEPLSNKNPGRGLGGQIGKENLRVRICRGCDESDGIDNRTMARLGERADHFHLGFGSRIGRIDDAEFGLAT